MQHPSVFTPVPLLAQGAFIYVPDFTQPHIPLPSPNSLPSAQFKRNSHRNSVKKKRKRKKKEKSKPRSVDWIQNSLVLAQRTSQLVETWKKEDRPIDIDHVKKEFVFILEEINEWYSPHAQNESAKLVELTKDLCSLTDLFLDDTDLVVSLLTFINQLHISRTDWGPFLPNLIKWLLDKIEFAINQKIEDTLASVLRTFCVISHGQCSNLSNHICSRTMSILFPLLKSPWGAPQKVQDEGRTKKAILHKITRISVSALGSILYKSAQKFEEHFEKLFSALMTLFTQLTNLGQSDPDFPKVMTTVLRTLHYLLLESKSCLHQNHMGQLVDLLRHFSVFNATDNTISNHELVTEPCTLDIAHPNQIGMDISAKLRCQTILVLTQLCRSSRKLFYNHWFSLLPANERDALSANPYNGPNILSVVLHDPNSKVRVAALICLSTILEDSPLSKIVVSIRTLRKRTGFSVAERNAKIVHGLHHGLLNGARKETGSTLIQLLKTFNTLVQNTDYDKLDSGLLSHIVSLALELLPKAEGNLKFALMSLLASVFGTATTQLELSVFLDPPPELAVKDSARSTRLISILLRLAKRRKKDDPYPDSRTVVQRLALKYRCQLSQWWEYGVKAFIIEGFESTDSSVIQATLRIVENWLLPCSTQNSDITPLEAIMGFCSLTEGSHIICKYIPLLLRRFNDNSTPSSYVRTRVFHLIFTIRVWQWQKLRYSTKQSILSLVLKHGFDEVECVRTSAAKAMGVVGTFHIPKENSDWYEKCCKVLLKMLLDKSNSSASRTRAAWALANMCDKVANVHHQHPYEQPEDFIAELDVPKRASLVEVLSPEVISNIVTECIQLATGNYASHSKIVANAIRAVGNVGNWLALDDEGEDGDDANVLWCSICELLTHEISSSDNKPKSMWNACYAAGNVLGNPCMPCIRTIDAKAKTIELYSALLHILQNSPNFKVRINACAALMAAPTRKHYGGIFGSLWISLIRSLRLYSESIQQSSQRQLQEKLCDKIKAAIFHMTILCTAKDLQSKRVKGIIQTEFRFIAIQIHDARHSFFVGRQIDLYSEKEVEDACERLSEILQELSPMFITEEEIIEFEKIVDIDDNFGDNEGSFV